MGIFDNEREANSKPRSLDVEFLLGDNVYFMKDDTICYGQVVEMLIKPEPFVNTAAVRFTAPRYNGHQTATIPMTRLYESKRELLDSL